MSVWTIVVAAGSGTRFGGPKQLAPLGGQRVLDWSVEQAADVSDGVVLVVPGDLVSTLRADPIAQIATVVAGGESRSDSVRNGLEAVPESAQVIIVHDGARPLAEPALFGRVVAAVRGGASGAVTAVPVTDTIRHNETGTVDRTELMAVQTPQGFWGKALRTAHASGMDATDDASLVEAAGGRVVVIEGSRDNLKITMPVDLVIAEAILKDRLGVEESVEDTSGESPDEPIDEPVDETAEGEAS